MIQIDHYEGAYGPTIWLEADSPSDLGDLLEIFQALARGAMEEVELCSATDSQTRNLQALLLRADEQVRLRSNRMRLTRSSSYNRLPSPRPEPPTFIWSERRAGWQQLATRVESLIRRNCAANHDLTEEGVDDVLVELSFQGAA
jgi:hypothetical protein